MRELILAACFQANRPRTNRASGVNDTHGR